MIEENRRLNAEAARRRSEIERERLELEQEARIRTEEEARHRVTDSYRRMEEQEARLATERLQQSVTETVADIAAPLEVVAADPAWLDVNLKEAVKPVEVSAPKASPVFVAPAQPAAPVQKREIEVVRAEKGITQSDDSGDIPAQIIDRLNSSNPNERAAGLHELTKLPGDDSFRLITQSFDDPAVDVRNAAARALHDLQPDRAATFTRALREGSPSAAGLVRHWRIRVWLSMPLTTSPARVVNGPMTRSRCCSSWRRLGGPAVDASDRRASEYRGAPGGRETTRTQRSAGNRTGFRRLQFADRYLQKALRCHGSDIPD